MFAYCGNDPVNRLDPNGEDWIHWIAAAAVVVVAAVVTVATCGGLAPAAYAVSSVACGMAATTTAATISASAFIGSATVFTGAAITAAATSHSADEFAACADWGTVGAVTAATALGAAEGYLLAKTQILTIEDCREVKSPSQIKSSDAVDAWDDFLGPDQTSINRFTGMNDPNRIFSPDGTKSIRFGGHEMDAIGTKNAHFHYEYWVYYKFSNKIYVDNILQRLK